MKVPSTCISTHSPAFNFILTHSIKSPITTMSSVAIVIYSRNGHVAKLAEAEKSGIESVGGQATIYQVAETLSEEIVAKTGAVKMDYPIIKANDLTKYDGILMGIPAYYGGLPAEIKAFWDSTGHLFAKGALWHKHGGAFIVNGSLGSGQEAAFYNLMSTYTHHGIIFVPLGYKHAFSQLTNIQEVHGGSPWGAGSLTSSDGSRQPSTLELELANIQGRTFYQAMTGVKESDE
ncbi:hypothetical protein FRC03_012620 [Tulasnella sp. 419]|nr:hypothetical protein FRC03_012620 [Tulasnella sp. 419]